MDDSNRMMGSGQMPALQSQSSAHQIEPWNDPQQVLQPATQDDFRRELTGCIALCMPAGFTEEARSEWLRAAWATLSGIPSDLLTRGCRVARRDCDHPAKIVPAIMKEIGEAWNYRRSNRTDRTRNLDRAATEAKYVTQDEIAAIKAEFGIQTNPYPEQPKPLGTKPRMPTRADYLAMGIDPTSLDAPGKAA